MSLYIHTDDYIEICLYQCPFADCIGEDAPDCPVQRQAEIDRAAGKPTVDPAAWFTLKELSRALNIPRREIEGVFYALRKRGVSIPGTWRRAGIWYYDRHKLNYYHRLVAPLDYGDDRPPLAQGNSQNDPDWIQERPVVVRRNGNGAVQIL